MKTIYFACIIAMATSQKPGYIGSGGAGYPGLASRFRENNDDASTPSLINRVGEAGGTTPQIPVDAKGDYDLVNRVSQWPRGNQPFWYINAQAIEAQRGGGHRQPLQPTSQSGGFQVEPQRGGGQRQPLQPTSQSGGFQIDAQRGGGKRQPLQPTSQRGGFQENDNGLASFPPNGFRPAQRNGFEQNSNLQQDINDYGRFPEQGFRPDTFAPEIRGSFNDYAPEFQLDIRPDPYFDRDTRRTLQVRPVVPRSSFLGPLH